jgi:uncharacterized protein (DUF2235 family)
MPKRLLFFLDGTAASAAGGRFRDATNVFRLNLARHYEGSDGIPQIAFYSAGVGTRGDWTANATAQGIDQIIREAYISLASNYYPGDQIYLFGYSRGGVAARALAGMLATAGLVCADHLDRLWAVWELFLLGPDKDNTRVRDLRKLIDEYKWEMQPKIEFLGLFDSVPGTSHDIFQFFSFVRLRDYPYLEPSVKIGVQLLSIDDNRIPSFAPLLWKGTSDDNQLIEQIWLPGVHADVGGNSDGRFISDVSLLTMIDRIKQYCPSLRLDKDYVDRVVSQLHSHKEVVISNERPDIWRKVLWRGRRTIGRYKATERIHPIFQPMYGQEIKIRGKKAQYLPRNYTNDLCEAETQYKDEFIRAFRSAWNGMQ